MKEQYLNGTLKNFGNGAEKKIGLSISACFRDFTRRHRFVSGFCFSILLIIASLSAFSQDLVKNIVATQLSNVNGNIFFWAQDPDPNNSGGTVNDLWKTDGTTAGTQLVKSFTFPGNPIDYAVANGSTLYFIVAHVNPPMDIYELWKSDGTTAGTIMILDNVNDFVFANGFLYYIGYNGSYKLFKTDGSNAATEIQSTEANWNWTYPGVNKLSLDVFNDRVYFTAPTTYNSIPTNNNIWWTDGTNCNLLVHSVDFRASSGKIKSFGVNGLGSSAANTSHLYFVGGYYSSSNWTGTEILRTDGTEAGTQFVTDFDVAPYSLYSSGTVIYSNLTRFNDKILFNIKLPSDGANYKLAITDGTLAGSLIISDFETYFPSTGSLLNYGRYGVSLSASYYYLSRNGNPYPSLFKTDGTALGTAKILDLIEAYDILPFQNGILFSANDGLAPNYSGIWKSDGIATTKIWDEFGLGGAVLSNIGNDVYVGAEYKGLWHLFVKSSQTITFAPFPTKTYGDAPFTLAATASSSLPITYTSSNAAVATISGNTVTIHGLGTTTITASQGGDANYNAAPDVQQTLTVGVTPPYCTPAHNSPNCDADHAYINTVQIAYGNASFLSNSGSGCPLNSNAVTGYSDYTSINGSLRPGLSYNGKVINNAGGCLYTSVFIDYNMDGDFLDAGELIFQSTSAPCGDGQENDFSFLIPQNTTEGTTRMRVRSVGDGEGIISDPCLDYYFGETEDYTILISSTASIAQNQTISLGTGSAAPRVTTDAPFDPGATASSSLPVSYTSSNTAVATVSGNLITVLQPGVTTITVSQPGNADFNIAPAVTFDLYVTDGSISPFRFIGQSNLVTNPTGTALDGSNNAYVAGNNEVQIIDPTGALIRKFGSTGTGDGQFDGNWILTLDGSGNIYVPDGGNNRIQVFDNNGNFLFKFGTLGSGNGQLNYPTSVALDGSGNIYVADYNNSRVQKFSSTGVYISQFGTYGTGDGLFQGTNAVTVDGSGTIYVSDDTGRIQIFDSNGVFIRKIGTAGKAAGQFLQPYDVKVDGSGKIYVGDTFNHRVQVFANNGTYLYTLGSYGTGNGHFNGVFSIAINAEANVLVVADNSNSLVQAFGIPDINVTQTTTLESGDTFDFGNVNMLANSGSKSFTIQNQGTASLTLTGNPTIAKSGTDASDFTITQNAITSPISAGSNTTFSITFQPSASGVRTAQISISNDDPDESPYLVNLAGTGAKLNQTITFGSLAPKLASDATFSLTATSSSGLGVSYSSSNTSVATVSGNTITLVGVGIATITANQVGDINYNAASPAQQTLLVSIGSQTITFNTLQTKLASDAPFELTATSSAGLAISYTSSNTAVATISGSTVTLVGAGSTTITASQPGNANFNAASAVQQTLTVSKGNQTITFDSLPTKLPTDAAFDLTATSSSSLAVSYASSNTAVATISGSTVTIVGVGTTTITASQAGNTNYNAATDVNQTLTVAKGTQTITFNTINNKVVTDAAFDLAATASSGLPVIYTSSNIGVATISGSTVTIVGVGTTTITASQAGNTAYNAATDVTQNLSISKADQTITFNAPPSKVATDAPFDLDATSNAGLVVTYTSSNTAVATISGKTVTLVGGGTSNITASQAGNDIYNAATSVTQVLTVTKATQTITFSTVAQHTFGTAAFALTATSSSGLAVQFTTTSNKISISGSQVTMVSAGSVSVTAAQPGDSKYQAATSVDQTFCINPAKPTITNTVAGESVTLTSSSIAGNQWFLNGTAISGATNTTLTVTEAGVYKVQASADGCVSEFSSDLSLVVTGDLTNNSNALELFPNPVRDVLHMKLPWPGTKSIQIYQGDGKTTEKFETDNNEVAVPVSQYAVGQYYILIRIDQGLVKGRFIKN